MSSTNKTTNYELSQYIGSDKPTYLGDYNSDMQKIDSQMKVNNTSSASANSKADTNATNIGTMSSLETTSSNLVDAINEVNAKSGDLNELESPETTDLVSAVNSVNEKIGNTIDLNTINKNNTVSAINEIINYFNLNTHQVFSGQNVTNRTNVGNLSIFSVTLSRNSNSDFFKLHGIIQVTPNSAGNVYFEIPTNLTISKEYNIANAGMVINTAGANSRLTLTLKTNGNIQFGFYSNNGLAQFIYLPPCLYINKDFSDQA